MPPEKPKKKKKYRGKPLDKAGHYRILQIAHDASPDDIQLAYAMAKHGATGPYLDKLTRAYRVLKDPDRREAYDAEGLQEGFNVMKSPITLIVAVAGLIAAFIILWLPQIQLRGKTFGSGQVLVEIATGREFGEVLRVDSAHQFDSGSPTTAYLVRHARTGAEKWYPEVDLQATCTVK